MKYVCVNCKKEWREIAPEEEGFSHGLCSSCLKKALIPIYRDRQKKEGNFDCFGTSLGYCDQGACKYRPVCLELMWQGL